MQQFSQDPRAHAFIQSPYEAYDEMRQMAAFVFWQEYNLPCAARYSTVDKILRDRRFGREVPVEIKAQRSATLGPFYEIEEHSLLELEPPAHTKIRAKILKQFTNASVSALEPRISALCDRLIDQFPSDPFDLISAYAEPIPVITISNLLGVPEEHADDLLRWSHAMVAVYQARRDLGVEQDAAQASSAFRDFIRDLMTARQKAAQDDLISALVNAPPEDRLSDDAIVSTVILLLNAGHEATVHSIANGVKTILQGGLSDEVRGTSSIETVSNEVLRFDPPLHMFTRYAKDDLEFEGQFFKRGDEVALLLAAANRDPVQFANPDQFDVTRNITPMTSFGAGIHFCVGAPLARLELDLALKKLFEAAPNLRLMEEPTYADRYHFHGLTRLMVEV
jgi:unspecific monooxygenase